MWSLCVNADESRQESSKHYRLNLSEKFDHPVYRLPVRMCAAVAAGNAAIVAGLCALLGAAPVLSHSIALDHACHGGVQCSLL